jgi:hypothetical protein
VSTVSLVCAYIPPVQSRSLRAGSARRAQDEPSEGWIHAFVLDDPTPYTLCEKRISSSNNIVRDRPWDPTLPGVCPDCAEKAAAGDAGADTG